MERLIKSNNFIGLNQSFHMNIIRVSSTTLGLCKQQRLSAFNTFFFKGKFKLEG